MPNDKDIFCNDAVSIPSPAIVITERQKPFPGDLLSLSTVHLPSRLSPIIQVTSYVQTTY